MVDFIVDNWETIFAVVGVVCTSCTAIVKVFSGCKWAAAIVKICDWLSVVNTKENKEKIAQYKSKK